jgi:uncharacterized protein YqgV (UPF0045/DUF77 family)
MLIAFSVAPSGCPAVPDSCDGPDGSDSVSVAVADAVRVVRESGLPHRTDAMFTTIEGDWDECLDVVRRATEAAGRHGTRVSLVLKADIRPGRSGEMQAKLDRLETAIEAGRAPEPPGPDVGRPGVPRTDRPSSTTAPG